jgi:predicted pyridoxine 5'-phosphate oxidase superfamily flavin-nucleotide-binding protein
VAEDDPALLDKLMPADQKSRGERVILFTVAAWDANCPKHIPQRFEAADVTRALEQREQRIAVLEKELARLKANQPSATLAG